MQPGMGGFKPHDFEFMDAALGLAARGLGRTWPNPAVGCVVVNENGSLGPQLVSRGWTQPSGRPHAEAMALKSAGELARGATVYVTLEPCCFVGKSPACTDSLIAAGIARVVVATRDPDPRVAGKGIEALHAAGISVDEGCRALEASALNIGQFTRILKNRPAVTLKIASTLDARTATLDGESQWITGSSARDFGHLLRANHDAILIGITTALTDNPALTCRLPGLGDRSPVRIVADSRLRLSLTSQLAETAAQVPTWILTGHGADPARADAFRATGIELIEVPGGVGESLDLKAALQIMGDRGLTRVLAEGGARLASGLLSADVVDRLVWMRAPAILGSDGLGAIAGLGIDKLSDMKRFSRTAVRRAGSDLVEFYEPVIDAN